MMRPCLPFIGLLCALGCSVSAPPPSDVFHVSGSRLRARVLQAEGGAQQLTAWWDTELEIECHFRRAEDGVMRCLPDTAWLAPGFGDPTCTRPGLYQGSACGTLPKYFSELLVATDTCGGARYKVRAMGERIAPNAFVSTGEGCVQNPGAPSALHTLAADPDPSLFVAATIVEEARSSKIAAQVLLAEDGTRQAIGLVDLGRQAPCRAWGNGLDLCLPERVGYGDPSLTSDAECTKPLARGDQPSCSRPEVIVLFDAAVPGNLSVHRPGDELITNVAYVSTEQTCQEVGMSDVGLFAIGPKLEPATYPAMGSGADLGRGRVRAKALTAIDGVPLLPSEGLTDRTLGFPCLARMFADGSLRCLPPCPSLITPDRWAAFADEACTERLFFSPLFPYAFSTSDDCGGTITEVRALHETSRRPAFQRLSGQCVPYDSGTAGTWWAPGEILVPSTFVRLQTVTE